MLRNSGLDEDQRLLRRLRSARSGFLVFDEDSLVPQLVAISGCQPELIDGDNHPGLPGPRSTSSAAREEARKEEMEYLVWQRFFSHYDLRCPRGQEPVRDGFRVIERTFQPDEIEP